jgi:bifunctional DNase/RNase
LQEKDGNRSLQIIVGSAEAQAIALYLEGVDMPRPMTHDLLINVLETLETEITQVTIARMNNGTFYAEIEVSNSQVGEILIDSRPSDAIAVALRISRPIYISDEVMDRASVDNMSDCSEVAEPVSPEALTKEASEEMILENLNEALEKAIVEEEYEVAARLRDRIKQLVKKSVS